LHGTKPEAGPFPGWEKDRYLDGLIQIIDIWGPRPDIAGVTTGITTLYYDQIPFWQMKYDGAYSADALPFLKEVLKQTYGWRSFCGGRGMAMETGALRYDNEWTSNSFSRFAGKEQIRERATNHLLGSHTYSGGYLF